MNAKKCTSVQSQKTYFELLKDPRWQKKRLEILERDNFRCKECGNDNSELHVHHKVYIRNRYPWDYHHLFLVTLCDDCHKKAHKRLTMISEKIGFMTNDQLYFTVDIINMLQLSTPQECLRALEFLTSELKVKYHV